MQRGCPLDPFWVSHLTQDRLAARLAGQAQWQQLPEVGLLGGRGHASRPHVCRRSPCAGQDPPLEQQLAASRGVQVNARSADMRTQSPATGCERAQQASCLSAGARGGARWQCDACWLSPRHHSGACRLPGARTGSIVPGPGLAQVHRRPNAPRPAWRAQELQARRLGPQDQQRLCQGAPAVEGAPARARLVNAGPCCCWFHRIVTAM